MFLRIWVRTRIIQALGRDDWTMMITQLFFSIYLACQIGGAVYGTGQHLEDLEPSRAERALSFWWACEYFYALATVMMKVSIGFFLLRVAVNKVHVWIIRLTMLLTAVFGGAFAVVLIFQCWPIHAFWTLNPDDGHCVNAEVLSALTYTISAFNVLADWIFALLPGFVVKDLQMPLRRKISVAVIMALAAVASTATIVRLPYISSLKESSLGWNGDFLYDTVGVAIWTTVEVGLGVTAGNIATLWPLVQLIRAKFGVATTHTDTPMPTPAFGTRGKSPAMELDGLKSGQGVRTVISSKQYKSQSGWRSRNSSEEYLARPENITRQVVVEYDEYNPGQDEKMSGWDKA
ncbi:hypothetical protein LTR78_000589 [Recurvomyces mirabilis]|uniref:Rhodopsin domain-containing protein n=1 Tax=Recurvomyces mirabilis TaxID=574656 RepID=A0AAE1C6P4_9PEZI|nr:hypothetical protein LTR78_000589 [Recurvomyces mirabilis]KAK5162243.1 hypothetical protein LTS14_000590 [Recurvomyces mirabilis]